MSLTQYPDLLTFLQASIWFESEALNQSQAQTHVSDSSHRLSVFGGRTVKRCKKIRINGAHRSEAASQFYDNSVRNSNKPGRDLR